EPEIESDRVGRDVSETAPHGVPGIGRRRVFADTEETASQRDDDVKGQHAPVGEHASMVKGHAAGALDEFVTETALARPRLRGDQDDLRPPCLCLAQRCLEEGELRLPADEAREATGPGALQAAPDLTRAAQIEHAYGKTGAFETLLP